MSRVSAAITGLSANWRVEFDHPLDGDFVRVSLYRDGACILDHDVRWYHKAEHGSYLANYSRSGSGGGSLYGTPLRMLETICRERLGIGEDEP